VPIGWVACVAAAYLIYVLNAVLMDVLVLRRGLRMVLVYTMAFLALGFVLQAVSIAAFGTAGWALCTLATNLLVLAALAREGLSINRAPAIAMAQPTDIR